MWQIIKSYPLAALAAVMVHVLLILILMINIDWPSDKASPGKQTDVEVIEARAVSEQQLAEREQRIREAERQKREAALARQRERERQAELKKQRAAAEKQRREEVARKQREAEAKKRREEEARKQREAEVKKRREEEARKQREAEEQRRREEEAARQQREAEQRREQARAEQALQEKLAAEAEAQARREQQAGREDEINQYKNLIKERITGVWRIPASAHSGMRCEIMVRLLPGGEVARVDIVRSSGDATFDRSVEDAVRKASPLPVPDVESGLFDEFRELKFSFEPKHKR